MENRFPVADNPANPTQNDPPADPESDSGQPVDASTALAAQLLALGQDCAARLTDPWRDLDHGALLYDDKGLPR